MRYVAAMLAIALVGCGGGSTTGGGSVSDAGDVAERGDGTDAGQPDTGDVAASCDAGSAGVCQMAEKCWSYACDLIGKHEDGTVSVEGCLGDLRGEYDEGEVEDYCIENIDSSRKRSICSKTTSYKSCADLEDYR